MTTTITKRICLLIVFIISEFISHARCRAAHTSSNTNNAATAASTPADVDAYDYEYYDDPDSESPDSLLTNTKMPPYFEQSQIKVYTTPNMDVIMDCDVKNIHANNVVIWYKGNTMYSNGQYAINHRVEFLKNNSILIKNVQADDAGNYYCEVLPENIRMQVMLEVSKPLTILCDGRDVLERTIVYKQGESHICECKSIGSTPDHIKWFINGQKAEEIVGKVQQHSIVLNNIDAHYAGVYQCLDDDGGNKPKHGMFNIVVHYKPKVMTHRHHINTELGMDAELYCDYKSEPIAIIRWIKDREFLSYSEKHMISYAKDKQFNRTTLTVKDVQPDDLGEYICQAENTLGTSELTVHLILEPERGQFEDIQIHGNRVVLDWLVRSLQPLSEAILDYKLKGSYTWSTTSILHTQRHEGGIWKVTHEMELTPGEWQTRIKTKNTNGWSHFSHPYIFNIENKDDVTNFLPELEVNPKDVIVLAGFGSTNKSITSSTNSSASTPPSVSFNLILIFIIGYVHNVL